MIFDLHVLWKDQPTETQETLFFLDYLGYNAVALTHVLAGKLPTDLTCPIPKKLPFSVPKNLRVLRRCTVVLSDHTQNHRLQLLSQNYDILAIRPTNEKSLQLACQSLDCSLISIDLTLRFDAHFKRKMLAQAVERGIKFEICYAPGLTAEDSNARRTLISNATQLIRETRGRGLVLSSEAQRAIQCRGPADVVNLASIWGLGPEMSKDALEKTARTVVATARVKRKSYRGTVEIVSNKPDLFNEDQIVQMDARPKKRNTDTRELAATPIVRAGSSEGEMKRRRYNPLVEINRASTENELLGQIGEVSVEDSEIGHPGVQQASK